MVHEVSSFGQFCTWCNEIVLYLSFVFQFGTFVKNSVKFMGATTMNSGRVVVMFTQTTILPTLAIIDLWAKKHVELNE